MSFLYILEIRPLSELSLANMLSHIVPIWFSFHFDAVFFSHAEAFYFDEVQYIKLFGSFKFTKDFIQLLLPDFTCIFREFIA